MKSKQLISLIVVTAALILGALFVRNNKQQRAPEAGGLLFPDIKLNDITRVEITATDATAVLSRENDRWVSSSRYGYPVRFDTVKEALVLLSELEVGQPLVLSDVQRNELKLNPPSTNNADASGIRVVWYYQNNTPGGSLIIGQPHFKTIPGVSERYGGYPDGQFVALESNGQAYVVPKTLDQFSPEANVWLDTEFLNVGADKLKQVTIRYTDETDPLLLPRRDGTQALMVTDLKKKEEEVEEKLTSISAALSYLTIADVADPALTFDQTGLVKPSGFEAQTVDGIQYSLSLGGPTPDAQGRYLRATATVLPPKGTNAVPPVVEGPATEETVKLFNERFGKWTLIVPSYKVDPMLMKRSDLVQKKNEDKENESDDNDE